MSWARALVIGGSYGLPYEMIQLIYDMTKHYGDKQEVKFRELCQKELEG